MFFIIKALVAVGIVVVAFVVLSPALEIILPNSTSAIPDAIQDDMDYITSNIETQTEQAIETVSGGVDEATSAVTNIIP